MIVAESQNYTCTPCQCEYPVGLILSALSGEFYWHHWPSRGDYNYPLGGISATLSGIFRLPSRGNFVYPLGGILCALSGEFVYPLRGLTVGVFTILRLMYRIKFKYQNYASWVVLCHETCWLSSPPFFFFFLSMQFGLKAKQN